MPLIDSNEEEAVRIAKEELQRFASHYTAVWLDAMRAKLGLTTQADEDVELINGLYELMESQRVDFTQLFRSLAKAVVGDSAPSRVLFDDDEKWRDWLARYSARAGQEQISAQDRAKAMDAVNPIYIPRNHKVEEALQRAIAGDLSKFETLLTVLSDPYTEQPHFGEYALPAPASARRAL